MRRIKTEQSQTNQIDLFKKKESSSNILQPNKGRKLSQLQLFNRQTSQNAKVKLSMLMHDTPWQPKVSPLQLRPKQFTRSIMTEELGQKARNSNKPSRFIEIRENQFFKKIEYNHQSKPITQNITFRNTPIRGLAQSQPKKQSFLTFEQQILSDIMAKPAHKFPNDITQKPTYISSFQKEEKKQQLYHIEGSVERTIEDFNNRIFGSRTVKKLINSVKPWVNQLQQKKVQKYKRIRIALVQLLTHIHKLKLTLEEFGKGNIFPKHPYQSLNSEKFFSLCKRNKADLVEKMLEVEKYLVYEYDPSFMTALHWSCVRNCRGVALQLLDYGADPDAQDMIGRTPLFLALLHDNNDIAQLILYHKADPWNKGNLNYSEAVSYNPEGKTLLQQTRRTHILLRMTPPAQRQYIWQQKQLQMLND